MKRECGVQRGHGSLSQTASTLQSSGLLEIFIFHFHRGCWVRHVSETEFNFLSSTVVNYLVCSYFLLERKLNFFYQLSERKL
jgi:hypothetical protein